MPYLAMVAVVVFWGSAGVVGRWLGADAAPADLAVLRNGFGIFPLLIGRIMGMESLHTGQVIALLISLAGVLVMVEPFSSDFQSGTWYGDLLAIGAMIAFSLYTVLVKKFGARTDAITINIHAVLAGMLFLLPLSLGGLGGSGIVSAAIALSAGQWAGLVYLGFFSTGLAYLFYTFAVKRLPIHHAVVFIYLQPIVGMVLSAVWLRESVTVSFAAGAILVLAGLFLSLRKKVQPTVKEAVLNE